MKKTPDVLIFGCGFLGKRLAARLLADGKSVGGWVRSEGSAVPLREQGIEPIFIGESGSVERWREALAEGCATVFCAAPGASRDYESSYRRPCEAALEAGMRRPILFVSSTSVYAQDDGSEVTELSGALGVTAGSKILLKTERLCLDAGGTVARLAGLYGPERYHLLEGVKAGTLSAEVDAERWVNQIHVDDAAEALCLLLRLDARGIFNVSDGHPVPRGELIRGLAHLLDAPLSHTLPAENKRTVTSKRISHAKLCGLGWSPLYPSWKEGVMNCLKPTHAHLGS